MDMAWIAQITDREVQSVEQYDALPCVLRLSGGFHIQIHALWRLLRGGRLAITREDDGQRFGRPSPVDSIAELRAAIVGKRVEALHVAEGTADLTISLGEVALQGIADSAGYEAWLIEGPQGPLAVGTGGGVVQVFDEAPRSPGR